MKNHALEKALESRELNGQGQRWRSEQCTRTGRDRGDGISSKLYRRGTTVGKTEFRGGGNIRESARRARKSRVAKQETSDGVGGEPPSRSKPTDYPEEKDRQAGQRGRGQGDIFEFDGLR